MKILGEATSSRYPINYPHFHLKLAMDLASYHLIAFHPMILPSSCRGNLCDCSCDWKQVEYV